MLVPDELAWPGDGVYTLMFFGTAPFGALLAGTLAQAFGPSCRRQRWARCITLIFALVVVIVFRQVRRLRADIGLQLAMPVGQIRG